MKTKRSTKGHAPERWALGFESGDAARDHLADLMRAGDPAVPFGPVRRARVLRRLRLAGPSRWAGVRFPALRLAVAAVVLMTSGGVITAATLGKWWAPLFHDHEAKPAAEEPGRKARPARRSKVGRAAGADQPTTMPDQELVETSALPPAARQAESPPPPLVPPTVDHAPPAPLPPVASPNPPGGTRALALVTPGKRPPARPAPFAPSESAPPPSMAVAPSRAPAALAPDAPMPLTLPPPTTAAPSPSDLQDETRLLGQAVMRLRQDHDARGALAAVDDYRARFPGGMLTREASIVQVDALLMSKHGDEALEILRGLALQAHGRDQELRLIRGELSAGRDCRGAIADFDRILLQGSQAGWQAGLQDGLQAGLQERALHGRASCRLRLGDVDGAVADLDLYLRQYPGGRFAVEARRTKALAGRGR